MKQVAAIIPNYNYAHFLQRRIDSILQQSYPISELIILDDYSTDNSKEVIENLIKDTQKSHPDIKIKTLFNTKNSGNVFSQWEKGINAAESPFIWICEADDLSEPDFLVTAMKGFKDNKTAFSFTNSKIIDQNDKHPLKDNLRQRILNQMREGNLFRSSYIRDGKEEIKKSLAYYCTIPNVSALVFKKSDIVAKALGEAKNYRLSGDWIFYLILAASGKVAYNRKALNIHRVSTVSVTSKTPIEKRLEEMKKFMPARANLASLGAEQKEKMRSYEQKLSAKQNK